MPGSPIPFHTALHLTLCIPACLVSSSESSCMLFCVLDPSLPDATSPFHQRIVFLSLTSQLKSCIIRGSFCALRYLGGLGPRFVLSYSTMYSCIWTQYCLYIWQRKYQCSLLSASFIRSEPYKGGVNLLFPQTIYPELTVHSLTIITQKYV